MSDKHRVAIDARNPVNVTAVVELPDATREALVALGWTPPADGD